jgi:hypothetical protein
VSVDAVEHEVEGELEFGLIVAPSQCLVFGIYVDDGFHELDEAGQFDGHLGHQFLTCLLVVAPWRRIEQLLAESECPTAQGVQRMMGQVI